MNIGFTASAFDLLHVGHIVMLEEAKRQCDYLICGLHVDPSVERKHKNKPVESVVERFLKLKSVSCVDEIIPYETEQDLIDIIKLKNVSVRILGEEYKGIEFIGYDMPIKFYFNKRDHRFSSTDLRERIARKK
jgi:glycerol-3-phosphate cytidylyltransferase